MKAPIDEVLIDLPTAEEGEREQLERTWRPPRGFLGWFTHANHRSNGMRFIVTAFVWFLLAGILAALMRLQLAWPENRILDPDLYSQVFSSHGTAMMFLFAVPVMEGLGIYLVPLMVGARNIAFPRLNAFGYWVFAFAGVFLFGALALNVGPETGWFSYVPLSGPEHSPGKRSDVWSQVVTLTEVSAIVVAVELIATIFKLRAPGMSLNRMPLFVWSILVMSFMIIFAMPAVMVASGMLALDRLVSTHFFNPAEGGDALLFQHLFWFFGHPEVYIMFIPGLGVVSSVVATFARRSVFGYVPLVLSLIATGFIGFGLWVHHMFATGLPVLGMSFFTVASMMIAVPSGVQIFCWTATLWKGRPVFATPLLFVLGFIVIFVLGGLTGVMLASIPLDLQVHDTFFVVAHFHYVLIGGVVFPLFAGLHYWFPKITGRMYSERLGRWTFGLMFTGFNIVFFPMHILGLYGMPRRVYTYTPETGWGPLNLLATSGVAVLALGILVFLVNALWSRRRGRLAGPNPWNAETLEWATSSPPPSYNFLHIPVVEGRHGLWDRSDAEPIVTGLRSDRREVLVTTTLDAEPDHREAFPSDSIWPMLTALALTVTLIGVMFTPWAIVVGMGPLTVLLLLWLWPRKKETEHNRELEVHP